MGMLGMRRRVMSGKKGINTNGFDFVDMGEAGIWATCNVGADSPEDFGFYFAFGETVPKELYTWGTYKFGTENNLTKYNEQDGLLELEPEDDAAHVIMGGDWRMPTLEEAVAAANLCNIEWVENYNGSGVNGRLWTLKVNPKKQLFFPAAGMYNEGGLRESNISGICRWRSLWPGGNNLYAEKNLSSAWTFAPSASWPKNFTLRLYGASVRGFIPKIK